MEELINQLDIGFDKVTAKTCQSIIKKVRAIEDKFWQEDTLVDKGL